MTLEETLKLEIWFVLQQIKKESLLSGDIFIINKIWSITNEHAHDGNVPTYSGFIEILESFNKQKLIKLVEVVNPRAINLDGTKVINKQLTILQPEFEKVYKKYNDKFGNIIIANNIQPIISYNTVTGIGYINNVIFKFRDNTSAFRVFKILFEKINKKINRYDILVAAHFYEDGEDVDKSRKTSETSKINDVAKKIRIRTGLNTKQLIMNDGNLTLVGKKTK